MTGRLGESPGRSVDFACRRLCSSMVVFGCLTDTWTDTRSPLSGIADIDEPASGRQLLFGVAPPGAWSSDRREVSRCPIGWSGLCSALPISNCSRCRCRRTGGRSLLLSVSTPTRPDAGPVFSHTIRLEHSPGPTKPSPSLHTGPESVTYRATAPGRPHMTRVGPPTYPQPAIMKKRREP